MTGTKTVSKKLDPHIRWLIRRDMPEVCGIALDNPDETWGEEDFLRALKVSSCIALVAELNECIVGYAVYELGKESIYCAALVVPVALRRRGIGAALVRKLKSKISGHRRRTLFFDVPDSNLDAHLFLKAQGFICEDIVRNWDSTDVTDLYRFVWERDGCDERREDI